MPTKVHMEALSPTMEEGQVVTWLKAEGDPVAQGDVLAEIETDKATMELVARGDGVLRAVFAGEGAVVPVGEMIAVIAGAEEDIAVLAAQAWSGDGKGTAESVEAQGADDRTAEAGPPPGGSGAVESAVAAAGPAASVAAPVASVAGPAAPAAAVVASPSGRVKASPLAKRLASELEVDLRAVAGSGPGGRIVKRDVEAAATAAAAGDVATAATLESPARPPFALDGSVPEFEDVPLTQMRKTVARRLVESLGPVPHFFLTVDVDMARALEVRARVNKLLEAQGGKASLNDLVVKAAAAALARHPECNAWWQEGGIRRFNRVHVGIAVAVPDGLITPVIRDAQAKGLARIAAEVRELAARAREKKLQPHEYTGSTFSVSNLGMFGIEEFTAVINPPEAGILAVGAVEERPVVVDSQVVPRPRMRLTMSCDHRVIDGAQGARFLATLKEFLEEPAAILI